MCSQRRELAHIKPHIHGCLHRLTERTKEQERKSERETVGGGRWRERWREIIRRIKLDSFHPFLPKIKLPKKKKARDTRVGIWKIYRLRLAAWHILSNQYPTPHTSPSLQALCRISFTHFQFTPYPQHKHMQTQTLSAILR